MKKTKNWRRGDRPLLHCELKVIKLFSYKTNSLGAINRQTLGCSVTSANYPRLYLGKKFVATAGFPAHNNSLDRFWAKIKWGCTALVDLSWNAPVGIWALEDREFLWWYGTLLHCPYEVFSLKMCAVDIVFSSCLTELVPALHATMHCAILSPFRWRFWAVCWPVVAVMTSYH